jgi:hypothetical protein
MKSKIGLLFNVNQCSDARPLIAANLVLAHHAAAGRGVRRGVRRACGGVRRAACGVALNKTARAARVRQAAGKGAVCEAI